MIKRIISTLMVFGLGIGLAMLLSWRYTKPIHNVVSAANRIAAGDLEQTLVTDSKDEIGELTQSFNFMVQKLREQRQMEEKLREAEHLSGIGQLSRSIAHEIRNPLNFISLSIGYIKEKFSPGNIDEKFHSLISNIKQNSAAEQTRENFLITGNRQTQSQKADSKLLKEIIEIICKSRAEKINIIKGDFFHHLT
jgi:nitrogen fixation/metabolism regulation signal transduction histidine kinase